MDRFDREILDYVRSWSPYGGPPADEVLAEFGLTPGQLTERVNHIIARRECPPCRGTRATLATGEGLTRTRPDDRNMRIEPLRWPLADGRELLFFSLPGHAAEPFPDRRALPARAGAHLSYAWTARPANGW